MTTFFLITYRNLTGLKRKQDFGAGFHPDVSGALRIGRAEVRLRRCQREPN
jgi:hypothetical protein